ncbi:hypothetical protein Cni_G15537 [Canna indica]|uniref:DUF7653 domain-containing protein n=1 Tax=Canna indica TaxID=4628 RepID=A0AAQ3KH63_9LILI|nr:hypothetical protein Cni_G15537 [Canna indica]
MKRFFSLRSFSSSSGNNSTTSCAPNNKKDVKIPTRDDVHDVYQSPQDTVLKPCNWYQDTEDALKPHLGRSLSFSAGTTYEGNLNFLNELSRSPSNCENTGIYTDNCPNHCQLSTPERVLRKKRGDLASIQNTHDVEFDSSASRELFSSGNSSCSSPVPLRCRAGHRIKNSSKTDIHEFSIDRENHVVKPNQDFPGQESGAEVDGCLGDRNVLPSTGRPPRVQHMRSSQLTYDKENLRSYSFRETNHIHNHSTLSWTNDNTKLASPLRQTRDSEKLCHAFSDNFPKLQDYDSLTTTTIDDVHVDLSDAQESLISSGFSEQFIPEITSSYEDVKEYCTEEVLCVQGRKCLNGNTMMSAKIENIIRSTLQEDDTDEELQRKGKELEQKLMLLSEENQEMMKYRTNNLNLTMFQIIHKINDDRKCLVHELSSQIKSRLSERYSAKERFKQSKAELDTRTRRLEKEKNEIQLSLEKELDRRSNDWSLKLEKFQSEEQRLRERVRELAEHNVALQREISSLKAHEVEVQSRILNSERQLSELTSSLEDVRTQNHVLQQSLSEMQDRFNGAEEDRNCLRRCYKEKEKENKELQRVVVKLQRTCSEQDKTISGLRQGLSDDLSKIAIEENDKITRLQMEQLRLTGVEQMLRKEVESCRLEVESLRLENISLLGRLQGSGNCHGSSFFKLDEELRARVDYLQTQGLSLLDNSSCFFGEILEFIKCKRYELVASKDFDEISIDDSILKHQSLKRGIENFRRNLQTTLSTLDDKSSLGVLCHWQPIEDSKRRQLMGQASEDEMEFNMRAEALLSRVLKENLCSRELQYEQLQADFATSIRARDVLQNANQRLQDELSRLTHKMKDLEHQIVKKDETIAQLHQEIHVSMKDLTAAQSTLQMVSKERDEMWEEVKNLRKTNLLLGNEITCLRKKIDTLDEDILLKEGQISILKDSMERPFEIIYGPKSMKEFVLE